VSKKSQGFALLLVLFVTTIVLTLSLSCWKKSSLLFDLVVERERFYKSFYRAEMLLNEGLSVVVHNFDDFVQKDSKFQFPLSFMLSIQTPKLKQEQEIFGRIIIAKPKQPDILDQALFIQALLYEKNCVITRLCCTFIKKQQVAGNMKHDDDKKHCFVVQNFTIGVFL